MQFRYCMTNTVEILQSLSVFHRVSLWSLQSTLWTEGDSCLGRCCAEASLKKERMVANTCVDSERFMVNFAESILPFCCEILHFP